MAVEHVKFLVEEPSMEAALRALLPDVLGEIGFEIHPFLPLRFSPTRGAQASRPLPRAEPSARGTPADRREREARCARDAGLTLVSSTTCAAAAISNLVRRRVRPGLRARRSGSGEAASPAPRKRWWRARASRACR